jgi:cytoskeleton protein RodZ
VKPAEATPAAATPAGPSERVLLVRAVDTAWVRVVPDGAPASEATLAPGAVRQWRSAGRFRVSLGNAGGVEIELDGQPLPPLGQRGQVVHVTIPVEAQP